MANRTSPSYALVGKRHGRFLHMLEKAFARATNHVGAVGLKCVKEILNEASPKACKPQRKLYNPDRVESEIMVAW